MSADTFDKTFPDLYSGDVEEVWGNCNYCVNHWGIDLCGCGSGEKFGECEEGYKECKRPAQSMEEEVTGCYCDNSW